MRSGECTLGVLLSGPWPSIWWHALWWVIEGLRHHAYLRQTCGVFLYLGKCGHGRLKGTEVGYIHVRLLLMLLLLLLLLLQLLVDNTLAAVYAVIDRGHLT